MTIYVTCFKYLKIKSFSDTFNFSETHWIFLKGNILRTVIDYFDSMPGLMVTIMCFNFGAIANNSEATGLSFVVKSRENSKNINNHKKLLDGITFQKPPLLTISI